MIWVVLYLAIAAVYLLSNQFELAGRGAPVIWRVVGGLSALVWPLAVLVVFGWAWLTRASRKRD